MAEVRVAPLGDLGNGNSDARRWPSLQARTPRGWFAPGSTGPNRGLPFDRFVAKIRPLEDGCWLWTATLDHGGYGTFGVAVGRFQGAHRFAYEHFIGPIPSGLHIDHLCRNRACVNPTHLEPVTHQVNVNRSPISRKVSDEMARQILASKPPGPKRASRGAGMAVVARRFGISQTTVFRIWHGEVSYVRVAA